MIREAMSGGPGAPLADAIVVAAGTSARMGGIDKRLAMLAGRPILIRTLEALEASPLVVRIVLVMGPGEALDSIRSLLPRRVVAVATGGSHRGASVEAGFRALQALDGGHGDPDRVILVHDGARPLVSTALIEAVATATAAFGAAVPIVPITDTIRRMDADAVGEVVDRTDVVASQTPQGARSGLLERALAQYPASGQYRFTDEAALLMACTIRVQPVPGDPVNFKVTLPADLSRADALLSARISRRVGQGVDSHPFGPGEPLRLGGIDIVGAPRLYGHSDGDVALHAVADGLLGAAGLGDLGRLFPADHRTPRGVDSAVLLTSVVARLSEEGWEVESVDLTITGARPRLAGQLESIRITIAKLLGVASGSVGVKAATGNLEGATGAGRAIAATALVSIRGREPASSVPAGEASRRRLA